MSNFFHCLKRVHEYLWQNSRIVGRMEMTEHNITRIMGNVRRAPLLFTKTDFQDLPISQERYFETVIGSVA